MNSNFRLKAIVLAVVIAILTATVAIKTYALFETNAYVDKNIEIGKWKIKLNGIDISEQKTVSISNFNFTNGVHTQSNYFAPGSSLYFDVVIDASRSDVSVSYDLTVDDAAIADHPNIHISITNLGSNEVVNDNTYDGIIMLSNTNRSVTLRINLTWDNISTYDAADTELIGSDLEFDINANFEQYIGE